VITLPTQTFAVKVRNPQMPPEHPYFIIELSKAANSFDLIPGFWTV
jgi:hypothetical protein